ncbi:PREDICTED: 39S ribosomal protein L14, mitochondrial isoform X1 [Dinoponera quadriceps]|uniref:Large ribosomal subunit protein uL14m n=2 Tax=Dinoponera quadriceps TaxID=609295 RepID=A0A6P3WZ49_DINQU|nr:PREDICTED: 39S ribosomal protein L14, mitochondrial isoform X1 [Dinoponera quadriceps]
MVSERRLKELVRFKESVPKENRGIVMLLPPVILNNTCRNISTSAVVNQIIKLSRLRVVDNSEIGKQAMMEGRPPRCIHIYNKKGVGLIGDMILVAIKGEKKKGILVGLKQHQRCKVPKFDSNNLVLIDDNGTPLGTRIHVPIPHILRTKMKEKTHSKGADYTKLIAIASRFV